MRIISDLKLLFLLIAFVCCTQLFSQQTYRDNFSSVSYSNNNGNTNFSAGWNDSEDGSPSNGRIDINGGRLRFNNLDGRNISRTLNLSGASSVTLTLDYDATSRGGEGLDVELWNYSTSSWQTVATINTNATGTISYALTANQISASSAIRFVGTDTSWSNGDIITIDNVLLTANMGSSDSDGDGINDSSDLDDDNDGILDTTECQGSGSCNTYDSDGDGVPNRLDLDSDNDGIYDAVEAGHGISHTNGVLSGAVGTDGVPNSVQASGQTNSGNVNYTVRDSDSDGNGDFLESDSDNDGCNDVREAGFTENGSKSGELNGSGYSATTGRVTGNANGYTTPSDNDSNGTYDYREAGSPPNITGQPSDQNISNGGNATFTVVVTGGGTFSYQWQKSNNGGGSYSNISGATAASYTLVGANNGDNGDYFRVIVTKTASNYICSTTVTSNAAMLNVINEPPTITASGDQEYCPSSMVPIVNSVSITDPDDISADLVIIQISSGYVNGEDLLTLTGSHPTIIASWSVTEGKLTLTGPATLAAFESAILAVQYSSSSGSPSGTRQFSITIGNANYLPATGHYYEYVDSLGITWTSANTAANARTYYGLQGYLATLTSQVEADFSGSQALGVGWIGASDAATEGVWLWVTGPEAGLNFWNGTAGGSSPNFAFWNTGEPNQSGNEDYAHITHPNVNPNGSWNDLSNTGAASGDYQPQGYVVEYGGMPGDPVLNLTATTTLTVDSTAPTASNPLPINVNCASEVPAPDITVVTDEADNCTIVPTVSFINDSSDGGSNPEIITRTYRISDASGNTVDVYQTITVNPFSISTQPADQSIGAGASTNFTVSANFVDTYQWQVSDNGGFSFTDISNGPQYSGSNTNTLSVNNCDIDMNGFLYRVILSNSGSACPVINSNNALLSVQIGTVITNRRITYRVNRN